jgi:TolA-binding protein
VGYNTHMTTTSTVSSPVRIPKNPMAAAVAAAERQLLRMGRRKNRAIARIARIQQRLANVEASIGQYDTVISQLQHNIAALKKLTSSK